MADPIFRTDDGTRWGAGKGADLTAVEADLNFWAVLERIVAMKTDPPVPVGIANVVVNGTQMTVVLTDATVLGPFTLPYAAFTWRGNWAPVTSYGLLHIVKVLGQGVFLVIKAHESLATFDPDQVVGGDFVYIRMLGSTELAWVLVSTITGATHTPTAGTMGNYLRCTNVAGCVVSLPSDKDLNIPLGTE